RPDALGLVPSLRIEPGGERVLKFTVQRRGSTVWPTKVIVKATGDDAYVRQECVVHVPYPETIEVTADGPEKGATPTPGGFVLHPFPNLRTNFQLHLQNRGPDKVLDIDLFALGSNPAAPLPSAQLSPDEADSILKGIVLARKISAVAGFKLPADGKPHAIPFTGPAPPEPGKPAAANAAAGPAANGPGNASPGQIELPFGLLLVLTEQPGGAKIIKRFEFAPQRPRRYVTARVDFKPDLQLLEIVVRRKDSAESPHRIKVRCELAEPAASLRQAVGEIAEGQVESRFSLPASPAQNPLRLSIAVDDYPRAFVYRLTSLAAGGELSEDTSGLGVRLTAPAPESLFACPLKSVPARVEVDAPIGSMPESQGFWEAGIDKDLDRELAGDNVVRFFTDRQVQPVLSGFLPDGRFAIDAQVGDFEIQLPTEGLCNARLQALAHASVAGRQAWSAPVEIVLDGAGPRVTQVHVPSEAKLTSGQELEVSAFASDGGLSGIAKVEADFDLEGTGRFTADPPPHVAAAAPDGRWVARLATEKLKPGQYVVLIRATDKVGNVGDYARTVVILHSAEALALERAAIRIPLRGQVEHKKVPVPAVTVSLESLEADAKSIAEKAAAGGKPAAAATAPGGAATEKILPVKTNADGTFVFPKVPLGKFKLRAQGVFRNKIRKVEQEITVDDQTSAKPLGLDLP
ncbi:MAG TPA: hypothetical protein VKU82_01125, partial [Planctomycetaceae bacterium]|nr:hypothetical protein [Planctomycetaceae bacterium]